MELAVIRWGELHKKKRLPGKQGSGGSGFETCTPVLSNITQMAQDNSKKVVILPRPPSVCLCHVSLPLSISLSVSCLCLRVCMRAHICVCVCACECASLSLCVCVSTVLILLTWKMLLICVQLIESYMSFFHAFPPSTFLYWLLAVECNQCEKIIADAWLKPPT